MSKQRATRIFIVDDEPMIAFTLAVILRNSGYVAVAYTSPLEALRSAIAEKPDLLISDVMMPELSGVELAIQVKRGVPQCGILLLSGLAYLEDLLEEARKQGHTFQLLGKPVHPTEILSWVQGHVRSQGLSKAGGDSSCVLAGLRSMLLDSPPLALKNQAATAL